MLPPMEDDGSVPDENGTALLKKHLDTSLRIGREAVEACLSPIGLRPEHLDALVTVTSTGMLCPSLSSHLGRAMGFRRNLQRADIVGMGCNAGVNGLATAARFAAAHPGTRSMLLACEICSAAYVQEMDPVTAVVNSLFGDGAVAALVVSGPDPGPDAGPKLLDFEAYLLHEAAAEMRFDFVDGKFSFYLRARRAVRHRRARRPTGRRPAFAPRIAQTGHHRIGSCIPAARR
ncbi:MAG: hypothetical protein M5R36_03405 [Deltaproteobacteria bacterium]|nr:hypothetical protein [Deltaproteobacteria bacterium]